MRLVNLLFENEIWYVKQINGGTIASFFDYEAAEWYCNEENLQINSVIGPDEF